MTTLGREILLCLFHLNLKIIFQLLWNEEERMWLDFDSTTGKSRNYFYASNLAPLWTGSYDEKLSKFYGDSAVDYLIRNNIINKNLTLRYICERDFYTSSCY